MTAVRGVCDGCRRPADSPPKLDYVNTLLGEFHSTPRFAIAYFGSIISGVPDILP